MERKEFIERCKTIFNNWCTENFQSNVEKIIDSGALNLDSVEPNYADCYPVIAAILQDVVRDCINGSSCSENRRRSKRKMNKYLAYL